MLLEISAIIVGLTLLVWAADRFVTGAASLAFRMGISTLVVGMTVVGFGTSAPEIVVAVIATINGSPGIAVGNAIGSNIVNIGLILGVSALVVPLVMHSTTLRREYPIVVVVTLVVFLILLDNELSVTDGLILLAGLIGVLFMMFRLAHKGVDSVYEKEIVEEMPEKLNSGPAIFWLLAGLGLLLIASKMLVWGASSIAYALGVSDLIIGLTIVALGTSLPELAASISCALKNEPDLAIGNVLGSNLYNLLAVLCVPALMAPGTVEASLVARDMPAMLALTLAIGGVAYSIKGTHQITRLNGALLLVAFLIYQGWIIYTVVR